jgi:WD40 repeat protein
MPAPEGLDPKQAHIVSQWPHDRPLVACRFDPAGRFVFCGSEDAVVERFKLADGVRTILSGGHETWVHAIAFSKDGAHAISGGCDGKITWWDAAADAPTPIRSIEAHQGWIRALEVSPDGTLLASGGNDNMVRLWNIADGTLVRELAGHQRHVYSVAFHPQGQFVLSGDLTGALKQWEVATGKEVRTFDAKPLHTYEGGQQVDFGGIRALAVSPDGKWLAAGGLYKATNPLGAVHEPLVLLFHWESQKLEKQQIAEGITGGVIWSLNWLGDGSLMGLSSGASGGFLLFWKPDADKDFHRFGLPNLARDMDLHPDGLQVATAHHDHHVRITRLGAKVA